ncbi:MAG: xanthine dehydrogenase family protein subunit M [Deltaproteobacteria bacterium]|nr:xanthine dehydrogenase family protein subunit M [Deltaproteobacteria bacterium]
MSMPNFAYARPKSLQEVFPELSAGARIHAGGTDLLGCLRDGVFSAEKIVSLSRLDELRRIERLGDGALRIGALTTVADLTNHESVKDAYPALAQAASEVASPQLRNQGTVGGNLCQKPRCWYYRGEFHCTRKGGSRCFAFAGENQYHCILGGRGCYIVHPSDIAPALVAYGVAVEIVKAGGKRIVPVEEFFVLPEQSITRETVVEPDEVLTAVLLPPAGQGLQSSYRKVRARGSWDFALAGVALALRFQGGRVAHARMVLSGAAPIPWRCIEAEKVVIGQSLDEGVIARVAAAAMQGARPLRENGYKVDLFKGLIAEELAAYLRN